jgi:dihydroneopterin aldolase
MREVLAGGRVPVWLPLALLAGDADIPESWDMTSDSLAAWLAGKLGAARVIYLKRAPPPHVAALADLVAAGILDPLVPDFLAKARAEAWLCTPRDIARLGRALAKGDPVGVRIRG